MTTPKITIGNPKLNVKPIVELLNASISSVVLFPELSVAGYSSGDLFFQQTYINQSLEALKEIIETTTFKGIYVLGAPLKFNDVLYNTAVVIQDKKILGVIPKCFLPNSKEFYEKRWFQSGLQTNLEEVNLLGQKVPFGTLLFKDEANDISFGVEVCQDMWAMHTPGDVLSLAGAHFILNLSASTEAVGKPEVRKNTVLESSRRHFGGYFYTSSGATESSTDLIYSSHKIAASLGDLIAESDVLDDKESLVVDLDIEAIRYQRRIDSTFRDEQLFQTKQLRTIAVKFYENKDYQLSNKLNTLPFLPEENKLYALRLANELQIKGLMNKFQMMPNAKIVVGISGGLDSALALLVAHQTFKRMNRDVKDIIAVTMPSSITSTHTKSDALVLMNTLGVTALEIPIKTLVDQHLKDLNHAGSDDVTFENAQARIRTLNLMNLANQYNGFVLGTGDMSEIALGWMTFNGDHMSMYNVNAGLTKTWVQALVRYHSETAYTNVSEILNNILARPISPELKNNQSTEDSIGKYEINDFILYHFLNNGASESKCAWLVKQTFDLTDSESETYATRFFNRFYQQQFKRQPMPEGPKILKVSLSPRGELRLPSEIKRR
ncbi:Glutamine-dependent NAD(+) synthetase [Acholeplasma hippikon]|uniref:Glutamine-dependent NAD(+) synthetase n=2 Tax=Acholeplasma hippikon TaxID=264636 RepID=A0A449BIL6_9MOLU|nr:Glutamine-dependent NAD(+) synthetase [Acholeplasma hippikon]